MLKTKKEVSDYVTRACKKLVNKPETMQHYMALLKENYNMSTSLAFDIMTLKVEPEYESDFVSFCMLSVIDEPKIRLCFTEKEIQTFQNSKFKTDKVKFPIKWKMMQVSEDQWIGTISVKQLMLLRNEQLINYNENAQRKLKRVVAGEEEWWTIDVNHDAVNKIVESYRNGTYIPNTITLNIPEDSEFHYDGDTLIINEISSFDILDGYHRYVAMSYISNVDKKFDYDMELRVVSFSEEKARQFIWQEDQKTKMNKIDSESLNQNNPANQVTQMLASKGILTGVISRNKGVIDYTSVSQLIGLLFFNTKKKIERKQIITTRDYIYNKLEVLSSEQPDIFDKQWDSKFLACAMYVMSRDDVEDNDLYKEIVDFYNIAKGEENKYIFTGRTYNAQTISRLTKLYEGGK